MVGQCSSPSCCWSSAWACGSCCRGIAVLAIAVALMLWLLLTRSGRLSLEAAKIGIASLPQRWGASSVIVVGIAGVVGVLVAMLAMGEGFSATLKQTGGEDTAIVLRGGSQAETNSVISRDQVPLISTLAGVCQGCQGRPRAAVAGTVADRQPADRQHRRGCERAVPRRQRGGVGDPSAGEADRRPQVQRRRARDRGRPGREGAVPRPRHRQDS